MENIGTFLVGGILVVIVALIIRSMIQSKKKGKSIQCGCDCKSCGGHCGYVDAKQRESTKKKDSSLQ